MPSPFPGMDPYLEAHWRDIHARLVIYASDALQGVLPRGLRARVEESVVAQPLQGFGDHPRRPDVPGVECAVKGSWEARPESDIAAAGPLVIDVGPDSLTEPFLEIIDRASDHRVVTVIEFLSPSVKCHGPNREQYRRKQSEVCASDANLVEIDLNRYGRHTLAFPLAHLKPAIRTGHMACVRRAPRRDEAEVYPMPLWERLPIVKVPLRPDDADVPLDLQALVGQCYRNGGYEGTLDYRTGPDPPLLGAEKEWAEGRLHELGLRPRKKPPRRKGKPRSR